jgi:ABC-type bacteriocin/lantibiotic exporter with double-glycine peptidase domain
VRRAPALTLAVALAAAGCGPRRTPPPLPEAAVAVDGVPFVAQRARDCGPAALAMVLGFFGEPASLEDLTARLYHPDLEGTLTLDLLLEARRRGLEARQVRGDLASLRATLADGRPLLVFLDVGRVAWAPRWHFAVAIGLTPDGVLLHSGDRAGLTLPIDRFMAAWARTDHWALDVRRPA